MFDHEQDKDGKRRLECTRCNCGEFTLNTDVNLTVVEHPEHYGGDTQYEAIKVIEAWELNFNLGNVLKYICRYGKKPDANLKIDLQKAKFYLEREIARYS